MPVSPATAGLAHQPSATPATIIAGVCIAGVCITGVSIAKANIARANTRSRFHCMIETLIHSRIRSKGGV